MEADCDIWGDVDFGHGPVEVRCTQQGPHANHRCEVFISLDKTFVVPPPTNIVNVFDRVEAPGE